MKQQKMRINQPYASFHLQSSNTYKKVVY